MADRKLIQRYRENWQEEIDSAAQYLALAESEASGKLQEVYRSLAQMEETHVAFWEMRLREAGVDPGPRRPSWRARVLGFIARKVNPQLVLSTIASAERVSRNQYAAQPETKRTRMAKQERWHALVLLETLKSQREGLEGSLWGRLEGRHRAAGGNALRAAVLGANDGLCSNLSLVMGVAGAAADPHMILLSGLAGMVAGAFSMALGEFISVMSARELAEREIRIERDELEANPAAEGEELKLIFEAKGLSPEEAKTAADQLIAQPERALETLTREELGIDPEERGGNPWEAAIFSFILFSVGALMPVLPFLLARGSIAMYLSVAVSALALFLVGGVITLFTGRSVWFSGARQLLLGVAAAGATFLVGRAFGAAVS